MRPTSCGGAPGQAAVVSSMRPPGATPGCSEILGYRVAPRGAVHLNPGLVVPTHTTTDSDPGPSSTARHASRPDVGELDLVLVPVRQRTGRKRLPVQAGGCPESC